MYNKSPFGSESEFANIGSWKAGSPASNPRRLNAQFRQLFLDSDLQQSHVTPESIIKNLHETVFFFTAATKGWAWCKKNAELVEHTVPLRDLKLLVGSGGLDFTKGMDSLNKHVQHISFRQCVTFWEHRQPKGWQPPSNSLLLKAQSQQLLEGFQQSHGTTYSTITVL